MNMKRNNKIKLCAIFLFVMCICDLLAQESFGEYKDGKMKDYSYGLKEKLLNQIFQMNMVCGNIIV